MPISVYQRKELNKLLHQVLELRDKVCLRCGNPQFQASHIFPKGRYRKLEFDPDNLKALCYACHIGWWHKNPLEASIWLEKAIPKARLDRIKLRAQVTGQGMLDYKLLKIMLKQEVSKLEKQLIKENV